MSSVTKICCFSPDLAYSMEVLDQDRNVNRVQPSSVHARPLMMDVILGDALEIFSARFQAVLQVTQ